MNASVTKPWLVSVISKSLNQKLKALGNVNSPQQFNIRLASFGRPNAIAVCAKFRAKRFRNNFYSEILRRQLFNGIWLNQNSTKDPFRLATKVLKQKFPEMKLLEEVTHT